MTALPCGAVDVGGGPRLPRPRGVVGGLPRYSRAQGLGQVRWRASSNESTVEPSEAIRAAIGRAASQAHLYPSLHGDSLIDAIATTLSIARDRIVVGGGSLAVLQQALAAYTGHGTEVVFAWRSYEAYPILVGIAGGTPVPVALGHDYTHDLEAMARAVTSRTRALIICNPNNPTGTERTEADIERLVASVPSDVLIILDEAYREFATTPVDSLAILDRHPNVAVFRTFSKAYGLAGLRAGYMIASAEIADNVRAASPPFGLSSVAEAAAVAAWSDAQHTEGIVGVVREGREFLRTSLADRGIATPVSGSNFVWIPWADALAGLEDACVRQGVSVRCFPGEGVRVTVGERDAELAVLAAVDDLVVRNRPG